MLAFRVVLFIIFNISHSFSRCGDWIRILLTAVVFYLLILNNKCRVKIQQDNTVIVLNIHYTRYMHYMSYMHINDNKLIKNIDKITAMTYYNKTT